MELNKSIGIWLRVSTEFQVKDDSPEHHEKRARLYAEAKGWNVKEVYRLDAISGKSVMDLPETKRMLKDIRSGAITGLIFSKLARLARNTKELIEFSEIFRTSNADLISLSESIDTSTPAGRLFYTMIAAMATWEREEIAERVAASVPIRAKLGKPLGGQASFGYRWDGKELVIDEKEAPIRKLMYELFAKIKRKKAVVRELNQMGFRTRNGSLFSDTTLDRLLRDSTAKGERIANYTKSEGEDKKWVLKPSEEWVIISCPAIVDKELWEVCNRILDEQAENRKPVTKRSQYLFTGLLYCECGSKMHVPSNSKKYVCLSCRKQRIDIQDLEEIFYENLKSFLFSDQNLETFVQKSIQKIEEKRLQLEVLREEKSRLEIQMDKLVSLHMIGEIPKEGFGKHYNPLNEQVKQIDSTMPELEAEIDFLNSESLNSDFILNEATSLFESWKHLDQSEKRQIIEELINRITLTDEGITFKFTYLPTSLNPQQNGNTSVRVHCYFKPEIWRVFSKIIDQMKNSVIFIDSNARNLGS